MQVQVKKFMQKEDGIVDNLGVDAKLECLMHAIDKILLNQSSDLSYVKCYTYCYSCVIARLGAQINSRLKSVFEQHFNDRIRLRIANNLNENDLKALIEEWDINFVAAKKIRDILQFYDNNYILPNNNNNLWPVFDLIMMSFRNMILENAELIESMQNIIFKMIYNEREKNQIEHRDTLKRIIDFLLKVKLNSDYDNRFDDYESCFENRFIEESRLYYDLLAQSQLTSNDAIKYIELYKLKVRHEKERIQLYLHERTESKILKIIEDEMIKDKLTKFTNLDKGLNWMLDNSCKPELKLIYQWYKKLNTLKNFEDIIGRRYLELSKSILNLENIKIQHQAAKDLFALYDKFIAFCNECWEDNTEIKDSLKKNCKIALDKNEKSPQILAHFIHEQIKFIAKNYSDHDINQEIEKFMNYFKLLEEKDNFQRYYENYLTSRLLTKKPNMDIEKKMAQKLQLECGSQYVCKINAKLMDMVINKDHMTLYYDDQNVQAQNNFSLPSLDLDFTILILRSFAWSFPQKRPINLPSNLSKAYDSYIKFYLDVHSGRKITLQPNKGSAAIKASYPSIMNADLKQLRAREYNFETSPFQMFVLLEFNKADRLTFDQIEASTQIEIEDLKTVIKSLLGNKVIKSDGEIDAYSLNLEYFNKNVRCRLMPENRQNEKKKVLEKIDADNELDRRSKIQAAAVKIMKMRKKLKHVNLVAEVIEVLKGQFKPEIKEIEQNFLRLIDREYIMIDETDKSQYIYLA